MTLTISGKSLKQMEHSLVALDALSETNRYSEPSTDQKRVKMIYTHVMLMKSDAELKDSDVIMATDTVNTYYNAIEDVNLKDTVRKLLED